jgi:hypothetical protein
MSEVLRQTTAFCPQCASAHPADVVIADKRVLGVVHCPTGKQEHLISSNADMYLALTKKSHIDPDDAPAEGLKSILNYISITNACNFHCAVCAADSGGEKDTFLTVEEIVRRSSALRKTGTRTVRLFGGEPTLHPRLTEIIQKLTRQGLKVWLVSNGYLLGRDKRLAARLKKCGLKGVCLQFDSQKSGTLDYLCRNYLDEKRKAIDHLIAAGLSLGFNCTTTAKNISELCALLEEELSLGLQVKNLVFGSAAPVGRYIIPEQASVDREQIIGSFLQNGQQTYFTFDDVFPLPSFLPWGAQIHPDCGAHVVLARTPDRIKALNHYVDIAKLYRLMSKNTSRSGFFNAKIIPVFYVLKSMRPQQRWSCWKLIMGLCLFRKRYGLLNIAFTDYRGKKFLDEQRLRRCAAAFHTSVGPVSACSHFYQGADAPGSLAYESAHGSC